MAAGNSDAQHGFRVLAKLKFDFSCDYHHTSASFNFVTVMVHVFA
jgi:hypothetical protein